MELNNINKNTLITFKRKKLYGRNYMEIINWLQSHIGLVATLITSTTIIISAFCKISKKVIVSIDKILDKKIKEPILKEVRENRENLDKHILEDNKTYLTDFITELKNGESKSEIQIMRAKELKRTYNSLGGDSFVDDDWKKLEKLGKL